MPKIIDSSANCLNVVKHFEGLYLKAYKCPANIPTIGYGTTIYPNGSKVKMGDACTQQQAEQYLKNDFNHFERMVDVYTRDDLSQHQFDALVSFCYNLGPTNLKSSTLLKVINQNPLSYAEIEYQWLRWNKANGAPLKGLTRRRKAEFHLYRHGELKFDF